MPFNFGISFGKNNKKIDTLTDVNKTETGSQSGRETTLGSQVSKTTATTSQTNQSAGASTTSQQQNQSGTTTTSGTVSSAQKSFSDLLASGVEGSISDILAGIGGARDTLTAGAHSLSDFDPTTFVEGIVRAAT